MPEITDDFVRETLAKAKPYTLVLLQHTGRDFAPSSQPVILDHRRRSFALREEGKLALGCQFTEGDGWAEMFVFDAPVDEVKQLMDADPAILTGMYAYEAYPVAGLPGESLPG